MKTSLHYNSKKSDDKKIRMNILKIYGWILFVGLAYLVWIKLTNLMIPCFYLTTSGFLCPGCGTTRMILSLLKLDFAGAFSYNPVTFCLFFIWNGIASLCFWGKWPFIRRKRFLFSAFYISLGVLICFWIIRNTVPIF